MFLFKEARVLVAFIMNTNIIHTIGREALDEVIEEWMIGYVHNVEADTPCPLCFDLVGGTEAEYKHQDTQKMANAFNFPCQCTSNVFHVTCAKKYVASEVGRVINVKGELIERGGAMDCVSSKSVLFEVVERDTNKTEIHIFPRCPCCRQPPSSSASFLQNETMHTSVDTASALSISNSLDMAHSFSFQLLPSSSRFSQFTSPSHNNNDGAPVQAKSTSSSALTQGRPLVVYLHAPPRHFIEKESAVQHTMLVDSAKAIMTHIMGGTQYSSSPAAR